MRSVSHTRSYTKPKGASAPQGSFTQKSVTQSSRHRRKSAIASPKKSPSPSPSSSNNSIAARFKKMLKLSLVKQTIIACVLAIVFGISVKQVPVIRTELLRLFKYPGEIYLRALKLLVVPMILLNMILVPLKLGDFQKAKKMGKIVILFYMGTTLIGVVEGLAFSNLFNPGKKFDDNCGIVIDPSVVKLDDSKKDFFTAILNIGYNAIDNNFVNAMLRMNLLGIIVFGLWFGFTLSKYLDDEGGQTAVSTIDIFNEVLFDMIRLVIDFTPIGIFSLISGELLSIGDPLCIMKMMGYFILTVLTANLVHWLVVLPALHFAFTRKNPYKYYTRITQAMMTAFASASSAAALPTTMKNNIENCGVSAETASFVLPLGATINMDGTAIYYPIAIIFYAGITGQAMNIGRQISIAFTSIFVSTGAAPVPSAGPIYLLTIIEAAGLKSLPTIALILMIDWLMDRIQVVVNISGDSLVADIIDTREKKRRKESSSLEEPLSGRNIEK